MDELLREIDRLTREFYAEVERNRRENLKRLLKELSK